MNILDSEDIPPGEQLAVMARRLLYRATDTPFLLVSADRRTPTLAEGGGWPRIVRAEELHNEIRIFLSEGDPVLVNGDACLIVERAGTPLSQLTEVLSFVFTRLGDPSTASVPLAAKELLSYPNWDRIRLVSTEDGSPDRMPDGSYPLIGRVWEEKNDDGTHYIYIISKDDPGGAFRVDPTSLVVVTA